MKKLFPSLALLLISTSIYATVISEEPDINFNHISVKDGLSSISVNSLAIDSLGSVWMGTGNGLNRYDGISVSIINNNDSITPIQDEFINKLTYDGGDSLYVIQSGHIYAINIRTFKRNPVFNEKASNILWADRLYICSENSLIARENGRNRKIFSHTARITAIFSYKGKILYGDENGKLESLDGSFSTDLNSFILDIFQDSNERLWISTQEEGVFQLDEKGHILKHLRHRQNDLSSISSDYVRVVREDENGKIWIGTYTGLDCLDPETGHINHIRHRHDNSGSLTHDSIWCIEKDSQGTMWVGTFFGGLNYSNPAFNIYNHSNVNGPEGESLSSPIIGKILKDNRGDLWIATEGNGVNRIDRRTGRSKWFNKDSRPEKLTENNVKDMYYDARKEELWIGLHLGGINIIDLRTGRVKSFHAPKNGLPSDDILSLSSFRDSIAVGIKDAGLWLMSRNGTGARRMLQSMTNDCNCSLQDSNSYLWISTNSNELFKLDPNSNQVSKFHFNSGISFMEDSNGHFWVNTTEELLLYQPSENTFIKFRDNKDLALHGTMNINESKLSGNIIFTGRNEVVLFNPVTKETFKTDSKSGFPLSVINNKALFTSEDGKVFIGGCEGLIWVNEKDFKSKTRSYSLFFGKLCVNGKPVHPEDGIVDSYVFRSGEITLPAGSSAISIQVSSSNHISANEHSLEYCLAGLSDKWETLSGNSISYTNLKHGRYKLTVRAIEDGQQQVCESISLKIKILPHWYESWIAKCLYFIFAVGLAFLLLSFERRRIKMEETLRYEKRRSDDLEELNQYKLKFFTNISHEIRTPLTIIIAEIESMIQQHNFTPTVYNKILYLYKSSLTLKELISELLEFRKQEQGLLKISAAPHDIVSFLKEFTLVFSEYASFKKITLSFSKETERLEVWYDQKQFQKVMNNIVFNSIKFTDTGGHVRIRVFSSGRDAVIEISDNGCGIPKDDIDKIFGRFYQSVDKTGVNTGTGIGLALAKGIIDLHGGTIKVESIENEGAKFTIKLPLGYSHFSKEQLSESKNIDKIEIGNRFSNPDTVTEGAFITESNNKHKIVIAEDNDGILKMLIDIFSPMYKVFPAKDGQEALGIIRKELPDIIVSDILMPKMSGTELCKTIKHDVSTCHIPIVLLTARVEVEQNLEGLHLGADDYITKPFNSSLLISRCNNLVNSRALLKEKYNKEPKSESWILATNELDKNFITKATDIVMDNLDNVDFGIEQFSKEMGMSRTSLLSKIKGISGETPSEFIRSVRMKEASKMLLTKPKMNIGEISDATGNGTPKYFSKCFKARFGMSPLEYRKKAIG